jgi:maleate cis-trans isomerase
VGVLVPSTNQTVEPDFAWVAPRAVAILAERLWNGDPTAPGESEADNARLNEDLERAARYLATVEPDCIVYACTGGTYFKGTLAYDREVAASIRRSTGIPAITAVGSCVEALRHVEARRLSVAGPYGKPLLEERLKPLLTEAGFEVINTEGEPAMQRRTRSVTIGDQAPETIADFVVQATRPEADTVFLPGTAWRALEVADRLEQKLGKTVITVNQASIWNALRQVGWREPIEGYGRLLRSVPAPAESVER